VTLSLWRFSAHERALILVTQRLSAGPGGPQDLSRHAYAYAYHTPTLALTTAMPGSPHRRRCTRWLVIRQRQARRLTQGTRLQVVCFGALPIEAADGYCPKMHLLRKKQQHGPTNVYGVGPSQAALRPRPRKELQGMPSRSWRSPSRSTPRSSWRSIAMTERSW